MIWRYIRKQRLEPVELIELQNKKLRGLIRHSYEYVPYYNSLFKKAKLTPDDIRTIDDLHKIPITKKEDIVDLPLDRVVASDIDPGKCWVRRTSGTSGTGLSVCWEKKALLKDQLSKYLWQLECGGKMTMKCVVIGTSWPRPSSLRKIGIFRTKRISPFDDMKTQIEQIKDYGPDIMHAYPSCIRALAKEIMEQDIHGIDLDLIFPTGELLDEHTRRLAEKTFDAGVFDSYGAIEVGRICNECKEHNGYHTSARAVLVEITRDGETVSPSKEGEVTVTNLDNHVMPFIRYHLEELGFLDEDECSCGNTFT